MFIEEKFSLTNIKLASLTNQNKGKPIILAVHGWLDNAASFLPMLPHLDEYHVIAIDLAGHGNSSHRSNDAHYHFVDWVCDLMELIEVNKWENVYLLGHSLGGMLCTALAGTFPDRFKAMATIEAVGLLHAPAEEASTQLQKAIISRQKQHSKNKTVHPSFKSALSARANVSDLTEALLEQIVERSTKREGDGYVWSSDNRLRTVSPIRLTQEQASSFIKSINVPALMVEGNSGFDFVKSNYDKFAHLYQNLTRATVDGGHHCHIEKPEEIANMITEFFKNS